MSWLNSLNNIKGQLTNLAQEVLAEVRDEEEEVVDPMEALGVAKRQNDDLNALCVQKENEITSLRKLVGELQSKISEDCTVVGVGGTKSVTDRHASLEDSWCWDADQVPSSGSSGKTDNDQNSELSSGTEMVNIPLDVPLSSFGKEKKTTLKELKRDKIELNEKILQLQTENQQLALNIEELDIQHNIAINNILGIKNDLQTKYNDVTKEFKQLKKTHAEKLVNTENDLEICTKKCSSLHASLIEYKEENDHLKVQVDMLKEFLVKKEQDVKELLKQLHSEESSKLKDRIDELTRELEAVQSDRKSPDIKISESSSGKQSSEDEFIVLQGDDDSQGQLATKDLEDRILELEGKLNCFTEENEQLKTETSSVIIERDQLSKDILKLTQTNQMIEKDKEYLMTEFEVYKVNFNEQRFAEIAEKNETLQKYLNAESDKLIDSQSERTILENELEAKNTEKLKLSARVEELENELKELETNLTNLLDGEKKENLKMMNELEDHTESKYSDEILLENTDLKAKLAELNENMTKCEANASDVESKLMMENVALQKKLIDLEAEESQQVNLSQLQEFIEACTDTPFASVERLEAAFKSIREKVGRINVLEKTLKELSDEYVQLQESKAFCDHEKKTLEADLVHYESEVTDLMKNNEILLNELENYKRNKLETIPENNEENIVILESQLEECNHLNRTLEEEFEEMTQRVSELVNEQSDLLNQIKTLEDQNTTASSNMREMQHQLEALEAEKCNLIFEINEMKTDDRKYEMDSEVNKLKAENASLEKQLERLGRDHADFVSTMQKLNANLVQSKKENEKLDKKLLDLQNNEEMEMLKAETFALESKLNEALEENRDFNKLKDAFNSLSLEKNELLATLQAKHSENIQYYAEIQRLGQLLQNAEKTPTACENCVQLSETLIQLEKLNDQITFLREKSDILTTNLITEQTNQRLMQQERDDALHQKQTLQKDLDRLREHLVEIEDSHTSETLEMQTHVNELNAKMIALEQEVSKSSNAYTSASIRANQHAETIQAQYTLVTQQRDELAARLSQAEDRESKNQAALVNLQCALEQFQCDKENDIQSATQTIRRALQSEKAKVYDLQVEISALNQQLIDANHGLLAASRISDQLETSQMTIASLKEEIEALQQSKHSVEKKWKASESSQVDKIEKSLIKSLVIGYVVSSNQNDKSQILKLISSVLDFNQKEIEKLGVGKPQSGWFGSLVPVVSGTQTKDSLMEAFVQFLDKESQPRASSNMPNLLNISGSSVASGHSPLQQSHVNERKLSNVSVSGSSHPVQPVLMNENVLDHHCFAPTRNSSSILKDILNDS